MRIASNKLKDLVGFYYSELKGVYDPEEIEALVSLSVEHFIGYSRTEMLTRPDDNINQSALIKLYDCCKDLKKNIPLQYILKEAWFFDLRFYVDPQVLIPRPETEELVKMVLDENRGAESFLDLGTGSGCIPVSIKKNSVESMVSACDISPAALKIAGKNATLHETEIDFFELDILNTEATLKKLNAGFDVIISNPPYIKNSEKETLAKNVLDHEPHQALFVDGDDNIIFYKKIIGLCESALNKKGRLYFELNPLTAVPVQDYAQQCGWFEKAELINDMSGKCRFLKAIKF